MQRSSCQLLTTWSNLLMFSEHYHCLSFFVPFQPPWLPTGCLSLGNKLEYITAAFWRGPEGAWLTDWLVVDLMYDFVRTVSSGPSRGTSLVSWERRWGGHNAMFALLMTEDPALAPLSGLSQVPWFPCRVVLLRLVFCKGLGDIETSMSLKGLSKEVHTESCNEGVSLHV